MNSFLLFIASNLFVACFIACLAYCIGRSGRFATVAHWLWLAVFIKLITPPIVPAPISLPQQWAGTIESAYHQLIPVRAVQTETQHVLPAKHVPVSNPSAAHLADSIRVSETLDLKLSIPTICLMVSSIGTCIILFRGVIRFRRFSKLLSRESVVDQEATAIVKRLLADADFVPSVRLITARVSPMLFGLGRNTSIVCPDRLWQTLSQADREAFLAHETAHYRRRDHWVRWLEWSITALYWWCPLVYIARQQLERHEEAACDAWAIASLRTPPRSYAEALLNVVDFLSETKVGVPRLASRMQATDTLEERLRLIMTSQQPMISRRVQRVVFTAGALLVLIHPSLAVRGKAAAVVSRSSQSSETASRTRLDQSGTYAEVEQAVALQPAGSLNVLPPAPRGWWNTPPQSTYANLRFGERDLQLLAEVGVGLRLQSPSGVAQVFDTESICALAYIASSGRLIVGNDDGELHLWDADSAQSVSLIGKHHGTISSVAYHPQGGLVSGDGDGVLSKWDLQSGELLNSISLDAKISSVRWARAGDLLAVVTGDWTDNGGATSLQIYSGRTFQLLQAVAISGEIAVVQQHEQLGWLAVDWSGQVFSLSSADPVFAIAKADVTGLVLCQDLFDAALQSLKKSATPSRERRLEDNSPH